MKILHVVPGLNEGGNGIAVAAKLIADGQSKHEVEVVDTRDFVHSNIRTFEHYSEVWVHSMWLPMTLKACWKVMREKKKVKRKSEKVVFDGPRLVRMTHANLDPVRLGYHGWKKRLVAPIERWLFRRTDRVVVTCEAEKEWCRAWGVKGEIEVVDLKKFFDLDKAKVKSEVEQRNLHILYLGRRHPLKGVEYLEQAVRELGEARSRSRTVDGELEFVIVKGEEAPFRKTKDALAWARATGLIGRMRAEETGGKGIVTISAESIRETLNPRQREKSVSDRVHFAALTKLRELIRESKILETHPDWRKDASGCRVPAAGANPDISICIAYAAFSLNNVLYRVRLTLKRYAQTGTSKAYAYRVNEIEVVPGTLGGRITPTTYPTDTTSICSDILLYGVKNVNGENLGIGNLGEVGSRRVELRIVSNHFGEELEKDWEWCDVLCLPTLSENFGLVVAEALERGKRVITTDGAPAWAPPKVVQSKSEGVGEQWRNRLIYLEGFRDGTTEERVRLLKEALECVSRSRKS